MQGNQQNRAMMLNSKVVDYINYILRASEFKNCDTEKVSDSQYHFSCYCVPVNFLLFSLTFSFKYLTVRVFKTVNVIRLI